MMTRIMRVLPWVLALTAAASAESIEIDVIRDATLHWIEERPIRTDEDGFVLRHDGMTARGTVNLPPAPLTTEATPRMLLTVEAQPIYRRQEDDKLRPNDPWTRLGSVAVEVRRGERTEEVELLRFITPYGAPAVYEQDVTALAPLLRGPTTFAAFISSYSDDPGWRITVRLRLDDGETGYRRPAFARHLFRDFHARSTERTGRRRVSAPIDVPPGLARPRIRLITTGHATDGQGGNEFVTATHILRIDGVEIARWRPWAENGTALRSLNPWAGRQRIGGGIVWASDFDRSGWHPGLIVEPLLIPAPELTAGRHVVQLEIEGLRPPDETAEGDHGYFAVSATVVADEPLREATKRRSDGATKGGGARGLMRLPNESREPGG